MEKRIQIDALEAGSYKAMYAFSQAASNAGLSKTHQELIKIRASQINNCAFCINMHTTDALKNGESLQRLLLLSAWKETDLFNDEERLLLEITEQVTLIHLQGLTDETYSRGIEMFGEQRMAQIIMVITVINAWNRIAVSTRKPF